MPNALLIPLDGFSASSRQMYPQLFPKLLSRTTVYESLPEDDVLSYIKAGWPNIILLSDPSIVRPENKKAMHAIIDWVKHGCTLVMMGFFASTVEFDVLNTLFKEQLGLKWRVAEYTSHNVQLSTGWEENMLRPASLMPNFEAKAVWLGHVPAHETIYKAASSSSLAYAAFGRIGLGKLGFMGDVNFGEEPERLILAMCHLDRAEDSLQEDLTVD